MVTDTSTLNQDATQAATATQPAQQPTTDGAISGQSNGATFTQEQVNKGTGKARQEGRDSAIADMLKDLGLTSKDELKSTIEDARKKADSEKTEVQRLTDAHTKKDETITQLQKQISDMAEARKADLVEGAIRAKALEFKANNPKTVLSYIRDNHKEAMRESVNDDGSIDEKKMLALMETVKKEDATLFTAPVQVPGSQSNLNGRVIQGDEKLKQQGTQNTRNMIKSGF